MNIGLVLSSPPGYSETFFTSKIKGLISNGHRVILFCQTNNPEFSLCEVKTSPKRSQYVLIQSFLMIMTFFTLIPYWKRIRCFINLEKQQGTSMRNILKKVYTNSEFFKTDLDWVHFGFATMALNRELIPEAIQAKMAVSFRGFDMAIYPVKFPGCYRLLWKQVDKVHTISDDLLHLAYNHGLSKDTPFEKITPAIDTSKFRIEAVDTSFHTERIQFLSVARLHWKKGLVDTVEALKFLKDIGISFQYTIIGSGPVEEELKFAIHQLGLQDHVTLTGRQSHDTVVDMMRASDIYIQYSRSEGFCNAVLEAQAMGLICVVSDAEGLPENVVHGSTGFVVPKRQPKLLAQQLLQVINMTQDDLSLMRNSAVNRVRDEFDIASQTEAFNRFYMD